MRVSEYVQTTVLCLKRDVGLTFFYNVQLWLILCDRLAIYYLNAVSKGYQQANMDLKRKMQMVSRRAGLLASSFIIFYYFLNLNQVNELLVFLWTPQARDEEKNRRNNKDSTNQVMKDLEDLLPNKSLIPPPTEEEELPPPGMLALSYFRYRAL